MAGKLTQEQRAEIVRRYEAGDSIIALSKAIGCSQSSVRKALTEARVSVRDMRAATALARGLDLPVITAAALYEAYAAPGSGYPSIVDLCEKWGVSDSWLTCRLRESGIQPRSHAEQMRIEYRAGRLPHLRGNNEARGNWTHQHHPDRSGPKSSEHLRKIGLARRRRVHIRCWWCSKQIVRQSGWASRSQRHFCDRGCAALGVAHARYRSESPRPLILARLRDLLREHPYTALPFTYETLAKAATPIGAAEPEILAVMLEGR